MTYFMIENAGYPLWLAETNSPKPDHIWLPKEAALKFNTKEEAEEYANRLSLPDYVINEHKDMKFCEVSNAISHAKANLTMLESDLNKEKELYEKKLILKRMSETANYIRGLERASEYLEL